MSPIKHSEDRSDTLVVFGVTGDLAHKMILPSLYQMARRGHLKGSMRICGPERSMSSPLNLDGTGEREVGKTDNKNWWGDGDF